MMAGSDDLGENYRGAFDGHLPFGTRPALLIVDFVRNEKSLEMSWNTTGL